MTDSLAGRLLVATPFLLDPNFYRTVVLLIEHDDDGALGVVLNRPLEIPVTDYLEEWESLVAQPRVVFSGGPVQQEVALAVARGPHAEGYLNAMSINDIQLVDLDLDPTEAGFEQIRVFSGYAAWDHGQLEREIAENAWWVFDSAADDPFVAEAEDLWPGVLRRQHGNVALFATLPDDPGMN